MARGDRQVQTEKPVPHTAPAPLQRPANPVIEPNGIVQDSGTRGPAVDALLHKATSLENEAHIAERNAARYRESAEDSDTFAARCRADAQTCRDAINRLSN